MSEKTKKVQLSTPMTWRSVNYAPGLNEMPAAAADYAARRNFGNVVADETEEKAERLSGAGQIVGEQGLPEDFPMRHVFEKLGFKSVEEVQTKTRDELIALDGIGEASADKALTYGK